MLSKSCEKMRISLNYRVKSAKIIDWSLWKGEFGLMIAKKMQILSKCRRKKRKFRQMATEKHEFSQTAAEKIP